MSTTPCIAFQGPSNLDGYNRKRRPSQQTANIPRTFVDAMEVREQVFVEEQGVPQDNEFDSDDTRACHWVVYAAENPMEPGQIEAAGSTIKDDIKLKPIGTIRLVPFPHAPHPEPGSSYTFDADEIESSEPPHFIIDRPTTYHDGREPYIKLGRLAVAKEYRGAGIAKLLAHTAMAWAQQNSIFFNASSKVIDSNTGKFPVWKGLMCVHAQEQVSKAWEKWGFKLDEEMGSWEEEGIKHLGMFKRFDVGNVKPMFG
ncbi:hypothetical protein LSUE1_G008110 [Lachnellula suecica]|uniref:N-acetyltransferase domain-containing protein n=1 Tax=Lachnellula suecica TaxID=602035 RepID=A0A8T9C4C4_9HELO|nr:hypothetical protein LSUE1_G008110 [Lachnellula suecica]